MKYRTWTRNIHGVGSQLIQLLTVALVILSLGSAAYAAPREQARRIHDRLAGVPPTEAVLASMEADVDPGQNNNPIAAAFTAMDNPNFYNVTLKNFASPWTNRDRDVFVPLNDYTATVIGMIRDDVAFNTLLSADILYTGGPGLGLPAYSNNNNNHYEQLESQGLDMMTGLVPNTQSAVTGLPSTARTRSTISMFGRSLPPAML